MTDIYQLIAIELKRQKKAESFPDHICAQANRIMCNVGSVCENAHIIKYSKEDGSINYLRQSLINTAATCLRMIEELEKSKI